MNGTGFFCYKKKRWLAISSPTRGSEVCSKPFCPMTCAVCQRHSFGGRGTFDKDFQPLHTLINSTGEARRSHEEAAKGESENAKYEENEEQLEEMAVENEQLLVNFKLTQEEHLQNLGANDAAFEKDSIEKEPPGPNV